MSRIFEYSSIENKHIIIKRKYDSMKDDINNNIIARISSTYEESSICFQDNIVVKKIIDNISKVYVLISKILEAKGVSAINNYENTTDSLISLNSKVNELISKLIDLHVSISKSSMEAYIELYNEYIVLNENYNICCSNIDRLFKSYNSSSNAYNRKKQLINDTSQSNPGYQKLCQECDNDYQDMQKYLNIIDDTISKQLNEIKMNLQTLMKNGLEKNIDNSKSSVDLPNGIAESYIK